MYTHTQKNFFNPASTGSARCLIIIQYKCIHMLTNTLIPYAIGELLGFPEYRHQIKGILLYTLYVHSSYLKKH